MQFRYRPEWNMLQPEFIKGSDPINIITCWCRENCSGLFLWANGYFLFEEEIDAMAFKLRWT